MKFQFRNFDTGETFSEYVFNPSQEKFWKSTKKYVLFSGGFGCGKSLMLCLKAVDLALKYPKNYILMGRLTYPELRDTTIKDFLSIVPPEYYDAFLKAEQKILFHNGSEIIFRHLDTIAESEVKSLNLGAFFIDQAEEVPKEVFYGLRGRLRRKIKDVDGNEHPEDLRGYLSCNPALTWLFAEFKQNPQDDFDLIEASTLENKANLSEEYINDLLKYPEVWKKQYVYGVWDADLLADKVVFAREYLDKLAAGLMDPIRTEEGLEIFREFVPGHDYQMGIDVAEGSEGELSERRDATAITIVDHTAEEEVASWSGRIPPDAAAEKAMQFARMYQKGDSRCLIVPEMNSIGLALINTMKRAEDIRIYTREEYDKKLGKKLEKLGWRTTRQTKPLLVSRFQELLRLRSPRIRSKKTYEEFKTFIWSDEAHKNGMGAQTGFHDDRLISLLLAFWRKGPVVPGMVLGGDREGVRRDTPSFLGMRNGRLVIKGLPDMKPILEIEKRWTA